MAETRRADVTVTKPSHRVSWRRILLPIAIPLLVLLIAHAGWRWQAGRALERQIEQLRAAGEPVLPEDFRPKEWFASDDNAAGDLTAAAAIVDDDSPESDTIDYVPTTMPVNPKAWPYLTRAAEYFQPALRRIERAHAKKACQWPHVFRSPVSRNMMLPELNGVRQLSSLLLTTAQ